MANPLELDYYYGIESEQFSFYRVPRILIKDERFKRLSSDAKLLYGLMQKMESVSSRKAATKPDNSTEVKKLNLKKSNICTSRGSKFRT